MSQMDIQVLERKINLSEKIIYVKEWRINQTSKTPILLIHESLGSVALWKDFPEKLAQATQRNVIAYDRLGFGQSTAIEEPLKLSFVADEAEKIIPKLLKQLGIFAVIPMGHSVGGGMAVACAGLNKELCKAVITISAQSMVEEVTLDGIRKAKIDFQNEKLFNQLAKYHQDKTLWVLDAWTETWLCPEFRLWNLDAYTDMLVCPLLVIHGENDQYATLEQPQRFIDLANTSKQLKIIQNTAHFPHKENSTEVLKEIATFLQDIE